MGGGRADCFLIDSSAAGRIQLAGPLEEWAPVLRQGRVGMCEATEVELLYSARSADQYQRMAEWFETLYVWRGAPDDLWQRVRELQDALVSKGAHRSCSVVDLVVAATAMHYGLGVLHYDRDFETLAQHVDLRTCWLAEPGSID